MTRSPQFRPVTWIPVTVYALVLSACLYGVVVGIGETVQWRVAGLVVAFAALFAFEFAEERLPHNRGTAAVTLAARAVLFVMIVGLDDTGLARALFVLLPFLTTFAFGRRWGLIAGAVCLAAIMTAIAVIDPDWYRDADAIGDVLMYLLGVFIAVTVAQFALLERESSARLATLSAAEERNRVARDVHDGVGNHLTAASIQLEKATAFAKMNPAEAERALDNARRSVRSALVDVRSAVGALRVQIDLPDALSELVARAREDGLHVELHVTGTPRLAGPAAFDALFRAAQEALTNARRHGAAERVQLSVISDDAGTRLVVTDDGSGFDTTRVGHDGFGLLGMRERAALVGGELSVDSAPGAGTTLTLSVPRAAS